MNENPPSPKCPRCGAPLPAGAPEGLCPSCLLALNLDPATTSPGDSATSAKRPEPPPLAEVARLFPQLEIVRLLGQGGMGAVYLARQPSLDRLVALKILHAPAAASPSFAERFTREARALARLAHPNIVTVHDFGVAGGCYFLLMEFVDGVTLRDLLQTKKISPAEALAIVPKICDALQFAHEHGIVHRDIKPENILLDREGRVKIADFGIAKLVGETPAAALTGEQERVGTPHYMAPEQVEQSRAVDHRADIFSLGVVFYEMLTGELPLGRFAAPSQRVRIDVRLDEVVLHALEKEPARRYQQASEVRTAVETIAATPEAARTASTSAGTTTAPGPIGSLSAAETEAFTREMLSRDGRVNVLHCFRRSWALIRQDFWPMIGVSAIAMLLLGAASGPSVQISRHEQYSTHTNGSSLLYMLIVGPLMGGLSLYYLRKIRGQPASVEVLFSGFTQRFVQLFLGGLVTMLLTLLGFLCLVLPGIYLFVAWIFTLTLIIDKGLKFGPAMTLSRKMANKHWWKLLGLVVLSFLLSLAGLLGLIVGIFITTPIGWLAATFAYEDLFGDTPASPQKTSSL